MRGLLTPKDVANLFLASGLDVVKRRYREKRFSAKTAQEAAALVGTADIPEHLLRYDFLEWVETIRSPPGPGPGAKPLRPGMKRSYKVQQHGSRVGVIVPVACLGVTAGDMVEVEADSGCISMRRVKELEEQPTTAIQEDAKCP